MTAGTDLSPSPWAGTVPDAPPHRFAPPLETPPRAALGGWWRRVFAVYVDVFIAWVLLSPLLGLAAIAAAFSEGLFVAVLVLGYVAYLGVFGWQLVRQGRTGATYGKELLGLRLVSERHGQPVGAGASVGRAFVHVIDYLPLYLGFLFPLWDRKRQTFADKAMSTLVLRVPRRRLPRAVAGLALALSGLLYTGSIVALDDTSPSAFEEPSAGTPVRDLVDPVPTAAPPPAEPAAVGPLPVEDTAGRIAPPAPGYTVVSDDVTGLGPLDVAQAAALGGRSGEEASLAEEGFEAYGLVGAYGRGFENADTAYSVLAYRFASPEGAASFQTELPDALGDSAQPSAVPGAVVLARDAEGISTLAGIFAVGSYGYEVTLLGEGALDGAELEALLVQQYEHALLTG